ncbi:MAG: flagellar motor protein MotB [Vicinamibacterales bacterium]
MKEGQVIIIKKKRGHGHGHHGGAWKVAYADFVTAMMAFFLVMWIVGQSAQVKAAIAGYFKDPGIFDQEKSDGPIAGGAPQVDPDAPTELRETSEVAANDQAELESTAERIRELLREVPDIQGLEDQVEITVTKDGLRIELLESNEGQFFDSGSATPKPYTERALAIVAGELGRLKNSVIVEGHTDSRPFGSDRYTNWELSADRANAARRVMERGGLYPGQVQGVRGFADTHLRIANAPEDSANRRVSIIVQNLYRPELLPEGLRGDASTGTGAPDVAPDPAAGADEPAAAPARARRTADTSDEDPSPRASRRARRARR